MNITEKRTLQKINTIQGAKWTQRNRYSESITSLFDECETDDQMWIVGKLIKDFNYIESNRYVDEVDKMARVIENKWLLSPNDTIVVAICDSTATDGSQTIVKTLEVQLPLNWKSSIHNNMNEAFLNPKKNIVLVDDFVGTGEKLRSKLMRLQNKLDSEGHICNIFLLSLAGMNVGFNVLSNILNDNLFFSIKMDKAISVNIINPSEKAKAINAMIELETKLLPITPYPKKKSFKEYNFGFNLSESIFYVDFLNIPNNVFPIFWKEVINNEGSTYKRNSIFRRR
jgi:hypothetical protein